MATPEKLASEEGKLWTEAFNRHWQAFISQRRKELKKDA